MGARILVIEANGPNLDLMTYLLNANGHTTIAARDGAHGFERIKDGGVDLVICDIELPKMDGYEIARRVRRLRERGGAAVPLVAVAGRAVNDGDRIRAAGFDGHVPTPISVDEFVAQVEAYIRAELRTSREQPADVVAPARVGLWQPGSKGRILLLDHSTTDLTIMENLLEPFGYAVTTAATLDAALARLAEAVPDLIIAGLQMPDTMGYDLLDAVRSDPALQPVPVMILASPEASGTERARSLARGAQRFMLRPIDAAALLDEVEALVERR